MDEITMGNAFFEETKENKIERAINEEFSNPNYHEYLSVAVNKDGSISVKAKSVLVAKIKLTKKSSYIEIKRKYENNFGEYEIKHSSNNWSRVRVNDIDDVLSMAKKIGVIFLEELSELGGEHFGCCHRYIQCSDAGQCVHPDFLTSLACGYKRNLESGRVFYGRNINI